MSANPWYQLWIDDWNQPNIRTLSLRAKGLLGEMERLAAQGRPYGHVTWPDGGGIDMSALAALTSEPVEHLAMLIDELQNRNAIGTTKSGIFTLPHLIRRDSVRKKRAKSGKIGASITNSKTMEKSSLPQQNSGKCRAPETRNQKPEEKKEKDFSDEKSKKKAGNVFPKPADVSDEIWADLKKLRNAKKAPVTATVIAAFRREADKIGWTLEQAISECCARGWQGFKAEWVLKNQGETNGNQHGSTRKPKPGTAAYNAERLQDWVES